MKEDVFHYDSEKEEFYSLSKKKEHFRVVNTWIKLDFKNRLTLNQIEIIVNKVCNDKKDVCYEEYGFSFIKLDGMFIVCYTNVEDKVLNIDSINIVSENEFNYEQMLYVKPERLN